MALTTVTVHGEILHPVTNVPAIGRVLFDTLIPLRDVVDNIVYVRQTFVATLDVNGEFTIVLPATDNANLVPSSWVYQVWVDTDALDEVFYVQIPFQLGTVEFADLNHVDYDPCGPNPGLSPIAPVDGIYVLRSGDTMLGVLILDDGSPAASEAWVLANAPGGVPANTVISETSFGQAPAVGVGTEYAREDHTHGTPATPAVPGPAITVVTETTFGQASAVGAATSYAREDHTHGTPAAPAVPAAGNTVVTETTFGQASNAGAGAAFSRVDHTHGTPAAPAVPGPAATVVTEQAFGQASATGVAVTYAREDHTHGTPTSPAVPVAGNTVVTEQAFGQASAAGANATFSRSDHTHGTPASPAVPGPAVTVVSETSFGQASAVGVGTLYARNDHTHGTPASPAVPTPANAIVTETAFGQASAIGVNTTEFAREDHTHGTPAAPILISADTSGIVTSGTITVPTASAVQIGPDLVVSASAGDILELTVSCLCADSGGELYWNAATRVGGADVTYFGTGTGTWTHPPGGISSFFTPVNIFTGPRASRRLTIQSGDISGGTVTVRVYARADNSSRDVFATSAQPLETGLVNLRQV